jgi:hypothetical protein
MTSKIYFPVLVGEIKGESKGNTNGTNKCTADEWTQIPSMMDSVKGQALEYK